MKHDIYIAAPLFNAAQHKIIDGIEELCKLNNHPVYSPRIHSEPFVPKGEDKKKPEAWEALFADNERGLRECKLLIAVLDYPLPENQKMGLYSHDGFHTFIIKELELPDNGVVWEMGYFRALGKAVIGFHPTKKAEHLNVMLTHGCDGLVSGWENLQKFFKKPVNPAKLPSSLVYRVDRQFLHRQSVDEMENFFYQFDWSACEKWGAQVGE